MPERVMNVRVDVSRWTEREIEAVDRAERVEIWREADRRVEEGATHVSLRVETSDEAEARNLVRDALHGLMDLDVHAFGPYGSG
jgi:5-carboxymethyl-2-hydroxymuconate isomerase